MIAYTCERCGRTVRSALLHLRDCTPSIDADFPRGAGYAPSVAAEGDRISPTVVMPAPRSDLPERLVNKGPSMTYRPDHERYHRHGPSTDPYDVEQREMRMERNVDRLIPDDIGPAEDWGIGPAFDDRSVVIGGER
jgi:hypothetical protein